MHSLSEGGKDRMFLGLLSMIVVSNDSDDDDSDDDDDG